MRLSGTTVRPAQAQPFFEEVPLVPPGFFLEENLGEDRECNPFPGESDLIGPAWARHRYQSLMARECARRGLIRLGYPPSAIPRLPRGVPSWPEGITGSLAHCTGYRAAIVGRTSDGRSAGIDAEPHCPLPQGVLELISSSAEQRLLGRLDKVVPEIHWDTLLFCVKEAVFKAWFPLTKIWLPMTQSTAWLGADGSFRVVIQLRQDQPRDSTLLAWNGRWTVRDNLVIAVTVRPPLMTLPQSRK